MQNHLELKAAAAYFGLGALTHATADRMSVQGNPFQYPNSPLFNMSPPLSEPKPSLSPGRPIQDLATSEVLENEKRNQPGSRTQMKEVRRKAVASSNSQQTTASSDQARSQDQNQSLMEEDEADFAISNVTIASVDLPLPPKDPVNLRYLKIILVGDRAAGKPYALIRYLRGNYVGLYCPTVMEHYTHDTVVEGCHFRVAWYDTSGVEDYDRLLPLSYEGSHVAILFFAIDSPDSLGNIQEKWKIQMDHHLPHVPKILAGCKVDLRNDQKTIEELAEISQKPVTRQQGEEVARRLSKTSPGNLKVPVECVECSALIYEGMEKLFQTATRLGLTYTDSVAVEPLAKMQRRVSRLFRRSKAQPPLISALHEFIPKATS